MPRIMMIDDDEDLLLITGKLLRKKGFEVKAFPNWEEGSTAIRTFNPHLLLLDVFLNDHDGLRICNKLKMSPFTRHIPVLVVSGFPRLAESAIYEFGADDFVSKPFQTNELLGKIDKILSRKFQVK